MVDIDSFFIFSTLNHELKSDYTSIKKKLFSLRQAVNDLFFQGHISKAQIARQKKVSRNFVIAWTRSPKQDYMRDDRGWPRGKRRKWDQTTVRRIRAIHERLAQDPGEFYVGATVIVQQWRKLYPGSSSPPLRTIGRILAELGLSAPRKKGRNKGAARYLCYPEHTIYERFGGRVLEADFVGRKYLKERTEPLNFIGYSFKKAPRLRYFKRIEGQTADNFIAQTKAFFDYFETPDYIKVDNTGATIGSASGKRNISRAMRFLLERQVVPIFTVPRKPFSQASIEGNNSVFARKFWTRREFKGLADVDEQLACFNQASQRYLEYQPPLRKKRRSRNFVPKVYFIRQVREHNRTGFIEVLHTTINLPKSYINYFVLAEWNLLEERLYIHFEKDLQSRMIKELTFRINRRSHDKHQHLLAK
jgi:hypothetical protein